MYKKLTLIAGLLLRLVNLYMMTKIWSV